jgi:NAD(P)-dependent dehydrogenase (short-subunit alcohol dehydrogenase family)
MGDQRTALVTGAASGIGRALASLLSQRGFRLHLVDINDAIPADSPPDPSVVTSVRTDVADAAAMQRLADEIGAVDLLCLNAGVTSIATGPPWEAPPPEWDRVFGVNVFGVVNGLRSFLPLMRERSSRSHILITASLAGAATWPGGGPYAASKHAVLAVAEQAALELAGSNISVTVLCPALVRTAMSEEGDDPVDVATRALDAVDEGRFAVIPEDWSRAVVDRANTLVAGRSPGLPEPTSGDPADSNDIHG